MSDTLSVSCQERSDTWRLFAEEPFTDGLLYQNKRLFSFLQLGCSQLRTKFRCRHFIFSRRYTRFSIRQGLRSILQLALGLTDDFTPRLFSGLEASFSKLRSLGCAFAHGLRASFRCPDLLFHFTEKFGSPKHEVQNRPAVVAWQRTRETLQIVFAVEGCVRLHGCFPWYPVNLKVWQTR